MPYDRKDLIPKDGTVQTAQSSLILIRSQGRLIQMTLNRMQMQKRESEWQKGQDLWSHLASNSFTFCSLQLDIRGAGRAEWPGAGAKGQDVTSDSGPHQPNQRDTAGRSVPALRTKERGRTLARQPPCSWLDSNSCLRAFKGVRCRTTSSRAFFQKPAHTLCCSTVHAVDVTWHEKHHLQLRTQGYFRAGMQITVGLELVCGLTQPNFETTTQADDKPCWGTTQVGTKDKQLLARAESPVKAVHKAARFSCINNESLLLLKEMQVANQPIQRTFLAFFSMFSGESKFPSQLLPAAKDNGKTYVLISNLRVYIALVTFIYWIALKNMVVQPNKNKNTLILKKKFCTTLA